MNIKQNQILTPHIEITQISPYVYHKINILIFSYQKCWQNRNKPKKLWRGWHDPSGRETDQKEGSQVMAGRAREQAVRAVVQTYEELKKEWGKKNRNLQTCGKYLADIKVNIGAWEAGNRERK